MKLRAVIDRVFAGLAQRFFFGHVRRSRCAHPPRKLRQPAADWRRIVIDDVVDPGWRRQRGHRSDGRVINVHPRPNPFATPNDRDLLSSYLIGNCAIGVVPGLRPVEESVAQRDTLHRTGTQHPRLKFRICARTSGNAGTRIDRQTVRLVSQFLARLQEKTARLLNVPANSTRLRRTVKIASTLQPQLSIARCGRRHVSRTFGQRGEFVDHRLGLRLAERLFHGDRIESANEGHTSAQSTDAFRS